MSAQPQEFLGAAANDTDALETREWLDALSAVIGADPNTGGERAHFLLETLIDHARQAGVDVPFSAKTAYVNTIPADQEERFPAISRSRNACAPICAGTRWRWWCARTA
jgi:pyruvate dehydrogenase E1 component